MSNGAVKGRELARPAWPTYDILAEPRRESGRKSTEETPAEAKKRRLVDGLEHAMVGLDAKQRKLLGAAKEPQSTEKGDFKWELKPGERRALDTLVSGLSSEQKTTWHNMHAWQKYSVVHEALDNYELRTAPPKTTARRQ